MGQKKVVEALVSGGKATAGPPLGPALGPLGVNVMAIVNKINELTHDFSGIKVPVKVIVDVETKDFEIEVGTPPTVALIVKELGIEKGSGKPNVEKVGNLTVEQVKKIAKVRMGKSYAKTLKAAAKEVLGVCVSMGVTVDGKEPKEVQKEIDAGVYDAILRD
ncbi:MAG: 50S ribosomal protein L11 [Candidatus Hecatellales archaeon ex4484_218]|nr:MAG: 50S ribosomal protein L11 [Candidatus Hecatellales archaeon ex4484_218]